MGHKFSLNVMVAMLCSGLLAGGLISCSSETGSEGAAAQVNPAEEIFNKKCSLCHGMSGDKQLSGAKKLTESKLSIAEIETMVTHGLRQMPSFSAQLTAAQIKSVSEYAHSFQNQKK
ncbi:MAG: cytochrome c [Flavobacteriales bacterium]